MKREEQFEVLENLFTWTEESVGHFKIAFYAHYQLLNELLDNCAERFRTIGIPRVDYFIYKEYVYTIYSQLSIVIECLCKDLLEDNGYTEAAIIGLGHCLKKLVDEIGKINQPKERNIYSILSKHDSLIDYFDSEKIFVNARYMTYKEDVSLEHINKIKSIILDVDEIYNKHFKNFDIASLVYPESM